MARQSDLFGSPPAPPLSGPDITLELHQHKATLKAWLLSRTGMERDATWAPKSLVHQHADNPKLFTLSRTIALQNGWL